MNYLVDEFFDNVQNAVMKNLEQPPSLVDSLTTLSRVQIERLAYIDFCLYFLGQISRNDLQERFKIASAAATRDFSLYRAIFPNNARLDGSTKVYVIESGFTAVFNHTFDRVMVLLSKGFGSSAGDDSSPLLACEIPVTLNKPSIEILASVSRAIHQKVPLLIQYVSKNGESEREIVPFAFANDGLRWHVRAFDRKNERFTDFVISRMKSVKYLSDSRISKHELFHEDDEWNRIVELELIPHPKRKSPEITIMDFGMKNGVFKVKVRAAMVGYILRQWHVDCSPTHEVDDEAFRLCLSDPLVLYGVSSAVFAPYYKSPSNEL